MAEKKLIEKILTYELYTFELVLDPTRRIVRGPVVAQCIGWDAVNAFLRLQGTSMVRATHYLPGAPPFDSLTFPPGWAGNCVNMENLFEEELWPTA